MCGGTSVFIALEAYGDNGMASAPSGKTPPLQFPMEKQEPYVIIPEADADLRAWVSRFLLSTQSVVLGTPRTRRI